MPTADQPDPQAGLPAGETADLAHSNAASTEEGARRTGDKTSGDLAHSARDGLGDDQARKLPTSHPPDEGKH